MILLDVNVLLVADAAGDLAATADAAGLVRAAAPSATRPLPEPLLRP